MFSTHMHTPTGCNEHSWVHLQAEAEKAAWELSKAEGFDLVTINPTFVLGPVIGNRADATSILCFKACALYRLYCLCLVCAWLLVDWLNCMLDGC